MNLLSPLLSSITFVPGLVKIFMGQMVAYNRCLGYMFWDECCATTPPLPPLRKSSRLSMLPLMIWAAVSSPMLVLY